MHYDQLPVADHYACNTFAILGSEKQSFVTIPWHRDIRLYAQNPLADSDFDNITYYKNIKIEVHDGTVLGKDIKVPWELARFHYTPILALAYYQTNDHRYADAAKEQICSWIDANPFCHGIHWFNGMEVAIRAVNWIVALQWLQKRWCADTLFYQKLMPSLYDHMRYLEHNWEWYDGRTNNHYLANLIGYAYLCTFFKTLPGMRKKWQWCYQQILQEFAWQVFEEGTSYEGSTRYHTFVTELFMHGFLIARQWGELLTSDIQKKLERMILFIEQGKPSKDQETISIGDDDSGSLLNKELFSLHKFYWFVPNVVSLAFQQKNYYKDFGLSLAHHNYWHVSLRHHAYTPRQPTGHFHRDSGSITLAYKGLPILVDPGTFVYTASSYWRNYFRSASVHNSIYRYGIALTDYNLFALTMPSLLTADSYMKATIHIAQGIIQRHVIIEDNEVRISDQCMFHEPQLIVWNFTFASGMNLYTDNNHWYYTLDNQKVTLESSVSLECHEGWISSEYGNRLITKRLQGIKEVTYASVETVFKIY